ncbi:hypothetical protein [Arthrobacter sp. Soil762]|uniref:hypothetical protein n=1 Tax=Arthrobacter sp. Soil762 TaxID=1736401 RepID=UPI0012E38074|nr:hypothetical protein [Arthrobacter sp. Soil762]
MTNPELPDEIASNGMSAVERTSMEKQSNEDRERLVSRLRDDTSVQQAVTVVRYEIHEPRAVQWDLIATLVAWAAALGAALGGVSIIADQLLLAGVLAIATAALSTFLAAAKPADKAASHKTASAKYRALNSEYNSLQTDIGKLSEYVSATAYDYESGQLYDSSYYRIKAFNAEVLDGLEKRFRKLGDKYNETVPKSPTIRQSVVRAAMKATSGQLDYG